MSFFFVSLFQPCLPRRRVCTQLGLRQAHSSFSSERTYCWPLDVLPVDRCAPSLMPLAQPNDTNDAPTTTVSHSVNDREGRAHQSFESDDVDGSGIAADNHGILSVCWLQAKRVSPNPFIVFPTRPTILWHYVYALIALLTVQAATCSCVHHSVSAVRDKHNFPIKGRPCALKRGCTF